MKLEKNKNTVEVNGVEQSTEMSIKVDGKIFAMLSDSLYQNKIGSIIREICSNAKDSHRLANNPEPFKVHLPNSLEPWLSVQDFGVGLSPDEMKKIYSVLLQSTKDTSNDDLGAFGLGSKTPLSYTENFTVTSIQNGLETFYSVFKDTKGIPQLATMKSNETDKPNGFTVSIPVKQDDFSECSDELRKQLKYFSTKPEVVGSNYFSWLDIDDAVFTVGNTEFVDYSSYGSRITIIQGEVGYKLSLDSMRSKVSDDEYRMLELLNRCEARLTFDIGQINVTLSREGLEYDKVTIKAIVDEAKRAVDGIEPHVTKMLSEYDTNWGKALALSSNNLYSHLAQGIDYDIPFFTLKHGTSFFNASDMFQIKLEEGDDGWRDSYTNTREDFMLKKYKIAYRTDKMTALTSHNRTKLEVNRNIKHIYIRDTNKQPLVRVKKYIEDNRLGDDNIYMVNLGVHNYNDPADIFTDSIVDEIQARFGGLKVIRLSELDIPTRSATRATPMTAKFLSNDRVKKLRNYDRYDLFINSKCWQKLTTKLTDMTGGVYVETFNSGIEMDDRDLLYKYGEYLDNNLADKPIYAFNATTSKRASKLDSWITLEEYIAQIGKKVDGLVKKCKTIARYDFLRTYCENLFRDSIAERLNENKSLIENKSALKLIKTTLKGDKIYERKFAKLKPELQSFYNDYSEKVLDTFSDVYRQHKDYVELENTIKDLRLLQYVPKHIDDDGMLHIIQYVNCMGEGA